MAKKRGKSKVGTKKRTKKPSSKRSKSSKQARSKKKAQSKTKKTVSKKVKTKPSVKIKAVRVTKKAKKRVPEAKELKELKKEIKKLKIERIKAKRLFKEAPLGFKILIIYLIIIAFFYLFYFLYGITLPTTIIMGKMVYGNQAAIANFFMLCVLIALIYGIWSRKSWALTLGMVWFLYGILNATVSFLSFEATAVGALKDLLSLSFISIAIVNGLIVWYLSARHLYFYGKIKKHEKHLHPADKFFITGLVIVWVITLVIGIKLSITLFDETKILIDNTIEEIKDLDYEQKKLTCSVKPTHQRDICYLAVVSAKSDMEDSMDLCNNIYSDFYKYVCKKAVKMG